MKNPDSPSCHKTNQRRCSIVKSHLCRQSKFHNKCIHLNPIFISHNVSILERNWPIWDERILEHMLLMQLDVFIVISPAGLYFFFHLR